ncbi:MAG: hypothetical protein FWH08_01775 [Oscillospiraceae bacterium]|nr:hypothetical protein [Oscillospiraceae bacterium]
MPNDNKMQSTKNNKKNDGKFRSKKIKHDPQAESARAKSVQTSTGRSALDTPDFDQNKQNERNV